MSRCRRFFLLLTLFLAPIAVWSQGKALFISDNRIAAETWSVVLKTSLDHLTISKTATCYDCHLTSEMGMASDVQRILSDKHISTLQPDVIFLQLGCNDKADSDEQYEQSLFDYPYGKVCTKTGTNVKTKNIAVSKDNQKVTNSNFAGSLYRIVNFLRSEAPDARLFLLSPTFHGTHGDSLKTAQLRKVANMLCIPFAEDISMITDYGFLWNGQRPRLGKVLVLGDSYSQLKKWTAQVEDMADVTFTNLGKVSATLKERGNGHTNTLGSQLARIPSGCHPDVILIEGGINDEADQQRFVDNYEECVATKKRSTFAGALAYIVEQLRKRFPSARIFAVTPGGLYYGHTDRPFDFIVKADQIRKAADIIGIQTIDWDKEGRLSFVFNNSKGTGNGSETKPFIYNVESRETGDLLHPNEVGARYLAENIIKEIIKKKK